MSQLQLLRERSYWPLFWTQFFGVFSQCAFQSALFLTAIPGAQFAGLSGLRLAALVALLYVAGALAAAAVAFAPRTVRVPLASLRQAKLIASGLLLLSASGLWLKEPGLWAIALAGLGFQMGRLAIANAAALPDLIAKDELLSANALLSAGGFLATLCGIAFGAVALWDEAGLEVVAIGIALTALIAALFGWAIPTSVAVKLEEEPTLPVEPWAVLTGLRERPLFLATLGIAWFWFLVCTTALAIARYADVAVSGDPRVSVVCAGVFCIGMTLGAFVCERLSLARLELGVVPLGSIGITICLADLSLASDPWPWLSGSWTDLVAQLGSRGLLRVALALFALGAFAGIFVVPLKTLLQQRTARAKRLPVMAGMQLLSAAFGGVAIAVFGVTPLSYWPHIPLVLLLFLNAGVTVYIYRLLPEFLLRFVLWCVSRVMYRVRVHGEEFLPSKGACVLVCNHVSFVDWMLVAAACPRPVRFVMYHRFLSLPLVGFLLRDAHVIPIAPAHEDAGLLDAAFERIAEELRAGEMVCIFPEGKLTADGKMNRFRTGIERVIAESPVPVIPMALDGMWGSYFSKKDGAHFQRPFRRWWSKVQLIVGPPMAPADVTVAKLERMVAGLGGFQPPSDRR